MQRQLIAVGCISLGLVLFLVSYLWPETGLTTSWTDEKSVEHAQTSHKLHQMVYQAADTKKGQPAISQSELAAQKEKFDRGMEQLKAAQNGGMLWARLFWIMGFLLTAGGVVAAFVLPPEPDAKK
jgi:hypothetical protein